MKINTTEMGFSSSRNPEYRYVWEEQYWYSSNMLFSSKTDKYSTRRSKLYGKRSKQVNLTVRSNQEIDNSA